LAGDEAEDAAETEPDATDEPATEEEAETPDLAELAAEIRDYITDLSDMLSPDKLGAALTALRQGADPAAVGQLDAATRVSSHADDVARYLAPLGAAVQALLDEAAARAST
jgi:hypothetical protein